MAAESESRTTRSALVLAAILVEILPRSNKRLYARAVIDGVHAASSAARCLNCGDLLTGAYCTGCGQAASTRRLRVKQILGDAVAQLFNLDSKVPRTVIGLARDPGRVVREYVDGRRTSYVSPLRYCLIVVAAMLVLYVALDINVVDVTVTSSDPDADVQQQIDELRIEVVRIVNARLNLVIFLALPLLGLVIRWLFRRSGRNYAECMAYVFYAMGQVFLLGIPFGLLRPVAPQASVILRVLLQVGYLTWAAVSFFREPLWRVVLRVSVATFLYMVAVGLAVAALAGPRVLELIRQAGPAP